jgi:NTP pyrophosphatase (non-canonical NTP hydrolase)
MLHQRVTILAERQMTARAITERAAGHLAASEPLPRTAARLADRLREHFDPATLPVQQVLAVAEEAGEFTAAYRRWAGLARRSGPWHDVEAELADVVITAYVTAAVLGIDLDAAARAKAEVVFTRGWREPPPAA